MNPNAALTTALGFRPESKIRETLATGLPSLDAIIEGFPRGAKQFIVAYCFEGRNAHQTLGMLLTRRMERMGLRPEVTGGTPVTARSIEPGAPEPRLAFGQEPAEQLSAGRSLTTSATAVLTRPTRR